MVAGTLAFTLGVLFSLQWRTLPDPIFIGFLPLVILLARDKQWRIPGLFVTGLLWTQLYAVSALNARLPADLEGFDIVVSGTILGIPKQQGDRQRFLFALEQAKPGWQTPLFENCRLQLTWYRRNQPVQAGTRWQFQVRLKRPRGSHNTRGPDFELRALRQGICATGYIRTGVIAPLRLKDSIFAATLSFRQRLTERIRGTLSGFTSQGIIVALVTGVRDGITSEQRQILQATGTAHLVAISGLHIGLLAGFGYLLGRTLRRLLPGLYPWPASGRLEALFAIGLAVAYAALAGFSLPTQRALIMLLVLLLAQNLGRRPAPSHALCSALVLVLIRDPLAVTNASFWLSFTAVAGLLYGFADRQCMGLRGRGSWLRGLGRIQLLAWVTLLPMSLYWFGGISLSSPLANLFAVPVTAMLVVPLALLGVLFDLFGLLTPARVLLELSATSMDLLLIPLAVVRDYVPLFRLATPSPPVVIVSGFGAVCLLLLPRGFRLRWLGGVWLLPLLLPLPSGPGAGALWLKVFDVGQGLAVLIRTRGHSLLYDTGPGREGGWNAGSGIIAPDLFRQGLRQLDRVLLSHSHQDHIGGTNGLISKFSVRELMSNRPRRDLSRTANRLTINPCRAGTSWRWDGYLFQILAPPQGSLQPLSQPLSENNASCVLKVSGPGGGVLLSGDIERQAELALLQNPAPGRLQVLESTVLLAPHHGSRNSSSGEFIKAVKPRWIVISRGYRNRFGFPHPQVIERYRAQGSRILDTTCRGSLELRFSLKPERLRVSDWRRRYARFWHVLDDGRCG